MPARRSTSTPRATGAAALVEELNRSVGELIKENRRLNRELAAAQAKASASSGAGLERSLRAIKRQVDAALRGSPGRRSRKA